MNKHKIMFYVRGRKYFVNNVYNIISLLILYLLYIIFIYLYIYIEYIYVYIYIHIHRLESSSNEKSKLQFRVKKRSLSRKNRLPLRRCILDGNEIPAWNFKV